MDQRTTDQSDPGGPSSSRRSAELVGQWQWVRDRTDGPFAVNHTGRPFDADAFEATLRFAPAAISFHMGGAPFAPRALRTD